MPSHLLSRAILWLAAGGLALAITATTQLARAGGSAKAGAKLYKSLCTTCHGAKGAGDGPAAKGIRPRPRKLNDPKVMSLITDREIAAIIKKGGLAVKKSPVMPPFPQLKKKQVKDLVAHLRALCKCDAAVRTARR